jgi:hypothetical protein
MALFSRKRDRSAWLTTTGTVKAFNLSGYDDVAETLGVYSAEGRAEPASQAGAAFVRYNPEDPQDYVVEGLPE